MYRYYLIGLASGLTSQTALPGGQLTPGTMHKYSSNPPIGTPLLPNNSVRIREVFFGDREYYMHPQHFLPRICVLSTGGVLSRECPLREGPLHRNEYLLLGR